MISEKLQQQIEDYLDGNLSGKELTEFEAQLKTDKTLASEVALYREMEDLLGETDVMDFKNTLNAVVSPVQQKEEIPHPSTGAQEAVIKKISPTSTGYRRWLSIAAGIALVALIGGVIYSNLNSVTPDTLYATHMEFPNALGGGTLRSTSPATVDTPLETIAANWQSANDAYQQQQFGAALLAMDKIQQIDPSFQLSNAGDFFFKKGLVQLKLDQLEAAIASFDKVTEGDYVTNAKWKKALTLLKVDPAQAKTALEKIANTSHPESTKASAILQQL